MNSKKFRFKFEFKKIIGKSSQNLKNKSFEDQNRNPFWDASM